MQIDVDRAVRAVQAAVEFDWTWTVDDLARFGRQVGWDLAWKSDGSPLLTTDFHINRPDVLVYTEDAEGAEEPDRLKEMEFRATDVTLDDPSVLHELDQVFDNLTQRIAEVAEQEPDWRWSHPTRGVRWDLLDVVVSVTVSERAVYVRLVGPDYQLWCDDIDRSLAQN